MEQSTKTILWVLAFITLPITIPLAIISFGILFTVLLLVLGIVMALIGLVMVWVDEILIVMIAAIICYVVYKWLSGTIQ